MPRMPLSVAIAVSAAVAFYALTIWSAHVASAYRMDPMGVLSASSFLAAFGFSIAAVTLAENHRGNY